VIVRVPAHLSGPRLRQKAWGRLPRRPLT
jgi:hypothetical protein